MVCALYAAYCCGRGRAVRSVARIGAQRQKASVKAAAILIMSSILRAVGAGVKRLSRGRSAGAPDNKKARPKPGFRRSRTSLGSLANRIADFLNGVEHFDHAVAVSVLQGLPTRLAVGLEPGVLQRE